MRPLLSATAIALCCLLIGGVAGAGVVGVAAGAPPPTAVCGVCGSTIDGATAPGTLDVYVDEEGDSEWVARVPVDEAAAERYREDPDALDADVSDAWHGYHAARGDVEGVETAIGDGSVVVSYAVADVARPGVGDSWLLDYFYLGVTNHRYSLEAERVTIHPPEGTVVTNRPHGATVDDGAVTWSGGDGASSRGEVDEQTHVTYAPDDGVAETAASYVTIARAAGPLILVHAAYGSVVPVGLIGIGTVVVARVGRGPFGPTVARPGYAALDSIAGRLGRPLDRRVLFAVAIGVTAIVGAAAWIAVGPAFGTLTTAFTLSAASFLPLGDAVERGDSPWLFASLAVFVPFVAVAALAPYGPLFGPLLSGFFFLPWAIGAVAVGYPLSLLGSRVGADR